MSVDSVYTSRAIDVDIAMAMARASPHRHTCISGVVVWSSMQHSSIASQKHLVTTRMLAGGGEERGVLEAVR